MGHSSSNLNICVSSSKDNSCIVWNYQSGELLRTFLLATTPLCLALDPCDRAIYVGFEDGSIQPIDLFQSSSASGSIYDSGLQSTPVQVNPTPLSRADSTNSLGAIHCLDVTFDGTNILSGHASGKIIRWDTGLKAFSGEIADANAPVTNLVVLSPLPNKNRLKAVNILKPRLGEGNYTFTAQFAGALGESEFEKALHTVGIPSDMLEEAIVEVSEPKAAFSEGSEQLKKENADLWAIVNEQRALQKRTFDKYVQANK